MGYSASDIQVLEGLEAVRLRPGMYIGTTGSKGMHHILWEIVDNGIDEVANGYGDTISIEIFSDNSICVIDNGRGIPVDMHPKLKIPALQVVFTQLHAGAKFNDEKYGFSGGLHGVGASVTNALSRWLSVTVYKEGKAYTMDFHSPMENGAIKSGIPKGMMRVFECDKELTGTKVHFLPDDLMFKTEKFSFDVINKRIRELAFLNNTLKISLKDNRERDENGMPRYVKYHYEGGLVDFVKYLNDSKTALYSAPIYIEKKSDDFQILFSMQHTDDFAESIFSYVNNIPTSDGGTHETGLRSALTKVFNDYAKNSGIIKDKQAVFVGEDFREGMTGVLAIKMKDVQFEGQVKAKLGNPNARVAVEAMVTECLQELLPKLDTDTIEAIYNKASVARKAREAAQKGKALARQLNSISTNSLVGKLSACNGKKAALNELFIVEGDSAGGTAKQGRDKAFQAILPLRGKPLNTEKKRVAQILDNEEIATIINALGSGFDDEFNIETIKYGKVIILADADQDGAHIRAILLTFFFRYMRKMITDGHVYIGMPPLYKVENKDGVKYAYDDQELSVMLENVSGKRTVQRYKGLGEMNPEQLWKTTMDPKTRMLMRVTLDDVAEAEKMITILMGANAEARKQYINDNANFNKVDVFEKLGG